MIDAQTAARIARDYGLGLPDAQALRRLADTEAEAVKLARQFAPSGENSSTQLADEVLARTNGPR